MSLPLAVHHRLDRLAALAKDVNASRYEIVGMLIADAALDALELEHRILAYRKMAVADVVEEPVGDGENVVKFERRGPGRPSRQSSP